MKKLLILLFLFALGAELRANDPIYKSLNKLYAKDPEKCLKRSKLFMSRFPEKASPYYFASKVSNDKATKLKTASHQYRNLLNALSYAEKFEKYSDSALREQLQWAEFCEALETNCNKTLALLDKENNDKLTEALSEKWNHFHPRKVSLENKVEEPNVSLETNRNSIEERVETPSNSPSLNTAKMMFGMPNGTENIPSYDVKMEQQLLALINAERSKKGMKPLVFQEDLIRACRYHALDMGTQNYFDHDTYDLVNDELVKTGETFDRIARFYKASFVNSENNAAGSSDAEGTYKQWYNSPGHNRNMFNASSRKVGIAVIYAPESDFGYYWVFCTAE